MTYNVAHPFDMYIEPHPIKLTHEIGLFVFRLSEKKTLVSNKEMQININIKFNEFKLVTNIITCITKYKEMNPLSLITFM